VATVALELGANVGEPRAQVGRQSDGPEFTSDGHRCAQDSQVCVRTHTIGDELPQPQRVGATCGSVAVAKSRCVS